MKSKILRQSLLLMLVFLGWASAAQAAIPTSERAVLTALYASTNGASWTTNTHWNGGAGTECAWRGITCDDTQSHVTQILLLGNNLSGSLPSLSGLTALTYFAASANQLSGAIPSLNGLTALQAFYVDNNQLTGPVPAAPASLLAGYSSLCGNSLASSGSQANDAAWGVATGTDWLACQISVAAPTCTLSATPRSISAGGSSILTASCSPAATSYGWVSQSSTSSSLGFFGSTVATGTVTPTVTTTYTVSASNASGYGNAASATVTVTSAMPGAFPISAPTCTLTATPTAISAGGSSTLMASCSPAATSYVWSGGTCSGMTAASCTVTPSATTTYSVKGSNAIGSGSPSNATVTVMPTGPFAFIPGLLSNDVSVVDVQTNVVVSIIMVGLSPGAVAIQPGGSKVYVGNFGSNTVSVIDPATMTQTSVILVGAGPRGLAVAPNGRRLYVVNNTSGTVSVIGLTTMEVLAAINVGASPWGVVTTPDSGKVYVANQLGNSVSVIDTANNTVIRTIVVGNSPYGLAVSPDGTRVFVANFDSNTVSVIDTATDTVVNSIVVDIGPFGLAVSPDGSRLYVTTNANTVSVINTVTYKVVASIPVGNHPQGVSVTPDGSKVFVANYGGNTLSVINAATNIVSATFPMANGPVAFGSFIAPSTANGPVIEFYNAVLDHYFITADSDEATAIDNGSAGPGWSRTGNTFKSGGSASVCRFYGSLSPGPNSHFYTVDPVECASLKQLQASTPATEKRWNFESLAFASTAPTNGTCASGTVPVYRAYNNGATRGIDSNHRITSNYSAILEVVARGWTNEGVVMCAPQ